jgi:3-phenylpropionate/trans-cinnamate dioxygenase ferredoxin reductase subunit
MSPDERTDVLIVGGGLAGASCAKELRELGFDGSIVLAGRERDLPYNRPPCSKGYLRGEESREDTLVESEQWWREHDIDVRPGTSVAKLDAENKVATLANRSQIAFDQALLATGALVKRLTVDGCQLDGIHYLRTLGNADTIREDAANAEHVVLIGGSYIGSEVAASLTMMGKRCSIVMLEELPLAASFGEQAGRYFHRVLTDNGVEIHGGHELDAFAGEGDRVSKVITKQGLELDADMVVIGAGVTPEIGEQGGVRTDAGLRTSAPGIFAAGDMAEYDSPIHGRPIRIEHWDVALEHGKTVARNMAGKNVEHTTVPYFFSDIGDWTWLEYVGPCTDWDREIVRGSIDEGEFSLWYLRKGRVAGALSVERSEDLQVARKLIAERTDLGDRADALADLDQDLKALVQ